MWDRFVDMAKKYNILVHDIDFSNPVHSTVDFDLVITKFNAELNSASGPNPNQQYLENLKNFQVYQEAHPEVIQLDPIDCQDKLTSRPKMLELFRFVADKITDFHVPQSLVLAENEELSNDFPFPAICKNIAATGSTTSHDMAIVWNKQGLAELKGPLLVQQLINHNSTIFKAFTIGDYSYMVKRPSIKNFFPDANCKNVHFNSQHFKELQGEPTAPLPPQNIIDLLINLLRDNLGLTLIGLDIITCSTTGKHYIIDANYFPGYSGVEDCPQRFLDLILHKLSVT